MLRRCPLHAKQFEGRQHRIVVLGRNVQIIRIRDGHIVHSRDFADPRILEQVIGEPRQGS